MPSVINTEPMTVITLLKTAIDDIDIPLRLFPPIQQRSSAYNSVTPCHRHTGNHTILYRAIQLISSYIDCLIIDEIQMMPYGGNTYFRCGIRLYKKRLIQLNFCQSMAADTSELPGSRPVNNIDSSAIPVVFSPLISFRILWDSNYITLDGFYRSVISATTTIKSHTLAVIGIIERNIIARFIKVPAFVNT